MTVRPAPPPPTPLMRVVLGVAVGAFSVSTLGALALIAAAVVVLGLAFGAAVLLAGVGALRESHTFAAAHWVAILTLAALLGVSFAIARLRRDKTPAAAVVRTPIAATGAMLAILTLVVAWLGRDYEDFDGIAAVAVLADLYFFGAVVTLRLLSWTVTASLAAYRWAAAERYRTGFVTALVLLFGILCWQRSSGPNVPPFAPVSVAPSVAAPNALELEREALVQFAGILGSGPKKAGPSPSPAAAASASAGHVDRDPVSQCLRALATQEVPKILGSLRKSYRLSEDDAHDLVHEALLSVCVKHAAKPYDNVAAVLQTAAKRRATSDWRMRRYLRCDIEEEDLLCSPWAPELDQADQIDRILDFVVRCKEDAMHQRVIDLHVRFGHDLAAIDTVLGLKPNQARDMWNNAIKRARARIAKDCGI